MDVESRSLQTRSQRALPSRGEPFLQPEEREPRMFNNVEREGAARAQPNRLVQRSSPENMANHKGEVS